MTAIDRRRFAATALSALSLRGGVRGLRVLDDVLGHGVERRGIPAAVAMVAGPNEILYQGAFGKRDATSGWPITLDSIFAIASMTKPITSVAAMQLVEQGKLILDEPVAKHLPQFATLQVLDGFDRAGRARLHRVRTPITLRHLLTHTAGFAYTIWHPALARYAAQGGSSETTLVFEPGTGWQYGYSADWIGRLIEKVSGVTLEEHFRRHLTGPLGMNDTDFQIPAKKFERMASRFAREKSTLQEIPRKLPGPPESFSGGGGLYGTAPDFVRFMQMILRRGQPLLKPESVDQMTKNQIGGLTAGKLKSLRPEIASDTDFHPGFVDKFGLGFLINSTAYAGGRSAGSLAWAGIDNTFFWIDPQRQICAALMMQYLPFCDKEAVGLLSAFERAVYANS